MSTPQLVETLQDITFLSGIADEYLEKVAAMAELTEFSEGELIFRAGDPATDIYLIAAGSVSLEICAPGVGCRRILTIGEGELLGWSPILEQARLTATARSLTPTTAVRIHSSQVLALCEDNPRFGFEFMRRSALALAGRLSAARLQLLEVYGAEAPRVAP